MTFAANQLREPLRRLWWLQPAWLFCAVVGGTALVATLQSDNAYWLYGTPKHFRAWHLVLAFAAMGVFAIGSEWARATGHAPPAATESDDRTARNWFWLTIALTFFGYAVWIAVGVKNGFRPWMLKEFLLAQDPEWAFDTGRQMFSTIKGVTTCAQFGVAALPLGLWLFFRGQRKIGWILGLLVIVAAVRALVYSERLALIELLLIGLVVVVRVCLLGCPVSSWAKFGLNVAPLAGILGLLLLFGTYEYFRSWQFHRDEFDSIAEFTTWRVMGYYTTAHNNGAIAVETQQPYPLPFATIRQLWSIPGLKSVGLNYASVTGIDPDQRHEAMLEKFGTPELNNEGGLFQPILDFGLAGYLVFWLGSGFVAGRLYRHYLVGTLVGLTLYPLIVIAILETPRLLYLSSTRSFPAVVVFLIVLWNSPRVAETGAWQRRELAAN